MKKREHEKIFFQNVNYWKPAGNVFAGDCMPFYHKGVFHLYYLWDIGHHNHPLFGSLGGHQWAHMTSKDLVNWEHHRIALDLDTENGECSNCTGSLLEWENKLYAFYALRSRFFNGEERFRIAISEDGGYTFPHRYIPDIPVPPGTRGQFRDPHAFIGDDGLIHVLITAGAEMEGVAMGQILHYTTSDMQKFTLQNSLYKTLRMPECSDFFRMGKYCYYTYASHWQTHYRMAGSLDGKWQTPERDILTSRWCAVMKSTQWKDNRRIGAAWMPARENKQMVFGGNIIFREILQEEDGSLYTAFVPEMIPGKFLKNIDEISITSDCGIIVQSLSLLPGNFRLDGRICFEENTRDFGFILRDTNMKDGGGIEFDPSGNMVSIDLFNTAIKISMNSSGVKFKLIRQGAILDLEIDGKYTFISPGPDFAGEAKIFAYVRDGKASFKDLAVYTW